MKPGEIYIFSPFVFEQNPERHRSPRIGLFRGWGQVPGGMEHVGKFKSDEFGTLIESNISRGGNGCKVITSSGAVGWMHHGDLEVLK